MDREKLFEFYKECYFHELRAREKLGGRLQIPLAIIVAEISLIGYAFSKINIITSDTLGIVFLISLFSGLASVAFAIYFFIMSQFNYVYHFIPKCSESDDYYKLLQTTYEPYINRNSLVKQYMKDYLYDKFIECTSINTENNDKRSISLHKTAVALITGFAFLFISSACVTISDSHFKNLMIQYGCKVGLIEPHPNNQVQTQTISHEEQTEVVDVNQRTEAIMSDKEKKTAPPPPAPPPTRKIREGREIIVPREKGDQNAEK